LLNNEKLAYEGRIQAEKDAEAQRQAKIKADVEEADRIRKENEKLKKEAEETKRLAAIEADKKEKELQKERAEQQKKLDAERKAREAIEAKIKADKEAQAQKEAAEKAQAEAIKQANEEAARKKLLAPDKEKLMELAQLIDQVIMPAVSSNEANSVIRATESMLTKVTIYIREKAKSL
jgi:membrane protein involved in colicin uptake